MRFARHTTRYPLALILIAALLAPLTVSGGLLVCAVALAVGWFFRDPIRDPPANGFVAPADGRVSVVRKEDDGRVRVGVFMNVHNVHVNRAPAPSRVRNVTHIDGGYRPAFDKDSDRNERVVIECEEFEVILIAGVLVRRITPYVEQGDTLGRGDRIGHIAFGSRADIVFPSHIAIDDIQVTQGESVRAGETVLARASEQSSGCV